MCDVKISFTARSNTCRPQRRSPVERLRPQRVNRATGNAFQTAVLLTRASIEIRNVDPLATNEEVIDSVAATLKVNNKEVLKLKTLRLQAVGTQRAIIELPANYLPKDIERLRVRVGLTAASIRVIPSINRCYRCNRLGHLASGCNVREAEAVVCRKCGKHGHEINGCPNEASCLICRGVGRSGRAVAHVAVSLDCPEYLRYVRETRDGGKIQGSPS